MARSAAESEARMVLYRQGLNDRQMADERGVDPVSIRLWRNVRGLPSNSPKLGPVGPEENAIRMLLYQLGWSDGAIGRERHRGQVTILHWRRARHLGPNKGPGGGANLGIDDLVRRIRRAVGGALPRDIAQDTASDLCLALMDGTLELSAVEKEARRYGNRTLERFASKFGPRSLDAEIGDEEGFTLLDTLRDDSQSSWLEEMGATAW